MSPSQHNPRDAAMKIVRVLVGAGHVAYFAGGCVRDALLGEDPKDYDIATDARPEQVKKLFRHAQLVGEAFGVVIVRVRRCPVEVATFRTEGPYADGRRPDHVNFTDAQHDAQRRDFTVNGLFENPLATDPSQRIIDFVGGRADLKAKLIRAIGNPDARFGEDYLRMLRAVRFAARLEFDIDPATFDAIITHAPKLAAISKERIGQEAQLMLTASQTQRARAARLIQQAQLDGPMFNEPQSDGPLHILERLGGDATYPTGLAAWMLDRHSPPPEAPDTPGVSADAMSDILRAFAEGQARTIVSRWRKALVLSNDDRDGMVGVLAALPGVFGWGRLTLAKKKRLLAGVYWRQVWLLACAIGGAWGVADALSAVETEANELLVAGVSPAALLSGDDLIALGAKAGPVIGRLLEQAYDAQLEGDLRTREQALSWVRRQL